MVLVWDSTVQSKGIWHVSGVSASWSVDNMLGALENADILSSLFRCFKGVRVGSQILLS